MTDLFTDALMVRRKLAEQASLGPSGSRGCNDCLYRFGYCQMVNCSHSSPDASKTSSGGDIMTDAVHIAANDPTTVIATIDELLRLREQVEALTNTRAVQLQDKL